MAQQNKNYADGVFIKGVWFDPDDASNALFSVGIIKEQFIAWLDTLPVNDKGYVNLSLAPTKDRNGMSMWENDYQGGGNGGGNRGGYARGGSQAPARGNARPQNQAPARGGQTRGASAPRNTQTTRTAAPARGGAAPRGNARPQGQQGNNGGDQATDDLPF